MGILIKKYQTFLFILLAGIQQATGADAIVVVAHATDKNILLNRQQVRNLFMGGIAPHDLTAIALPADNQTRVLFNTKVVGLTESRIQSYWAQMRFTGRNKPPMELSSEALLLEYLKRNRGAVGYLPADIILPAELTVLYRSN